MDTLLGFISGAAVSIGAVVVYLKVFLQKMVESKLTKGINEHKNKLEAVTEEIKHGYQKEIHNWSMYNTKKHEIYPTYYKRILKFHQNLTSDPTRHFEQVLGINEEEDINFAERYMIDPKVIKQIYENDSDYVDRMMKIEFLIQQYEFEQLSKEFNSLISDLEQDELYFSNKVFSITRKIIDNLNKLMINKEIAVYQIQNRTGFKGEENKIGGDLLNGFAALKNYMSNEMQTGN
ncbi:hypothetical protein [Jeotgalibacillus malaysiensis]|uniref:hypothetical protein n=1 Tax=Jeotgalibacillus malaysiensis TaxID=1508404 RepID=UPI00384E8954